jgi:CheY-like chemotaxis protein
MAMDMEDRSGRDGAPKRKVLVVDDNPVARATAVALFEDLGFEVLNAYRGDLALALVTEHTDLCLLFVDVRMPGMSGPDFVAAAQRIRPGVKVIFTSGVHHGIPVPGDVPFVPKPWKLEQVSQIIIDTVERDGSLH